MIALNQHPQQNTDRKSYLKKVVENEGHIVCQAKNFVFALIKFALINIAADQNCKPKTIGKLLNYLQ